MQSRIETPLWEPCPKLEAQIATTSSQKKSGIVDPACWRIERTELKFAKLGSQLQQFRGWRTPEPLVQRRCDHQTATAWKRFRQGTVPGNCSKTTPPLSERSRAVRWLASGLRRQGRCSTRWLSHAPLKSPALLPGATTPQCAAWQTAQRCNQPR